MMHEQNQYGKRIEIMIERATMARAKKRRYNSKLMDTFRATWWHLIWFFLNIIIITLNDFQSTSKDQQQQKKHKPKRYSYDKSAKETQ